MQKNQTMENLLMQKRMPKKICEDHAEWKLQLEMLNAKKKLLTQEQAPARAPLKLEKV
jgi:hypothetical protein